jgi:hypothetical protein
MIKSSLVRTRQGARPAVVNRTIVAKPCGLYNFETCLLIVLARKLDAMSENPYEPPKCSFEPLRPDLRSPYRESQRLLDDVAIAFHNTRVAIDDLFSERPRGWFFKGRKGPRKIISSLWVDEQIDMAQLRYSWRELGKQIDCPLPAIELSKGDELLWHGQRATLSHIIDHVIRCGKLGNRSPPPSLTVADWRNAQVFAGVQQVLIDQCGVDKDEVFRSASLVDDLRLF